MNQLQIFKNLRFGQVRTLNINKEPWFIGKDVAEILGYTNPLKAIRDHVDEDDKGVNEMDTPGGNQKLMAINESGLYSLIFSSKLPQAKEFKKWVTSEVIPTIRKTGGYIPTNEEDSESDILAKAVLIAQKTIKQKDKLLKVKEEELTRTKENLESKDRFINQIAISENSLLVREVAKIASKEGINIGEKRLWNKLREWGLIFKASTEAKQEGIDRGYFEVVEGSKTNKDKTFTYSTTRVTGKGQVYIIRKLLQEQEA